VKSYSSKKVAKVLPVMLHPFLMPPHPITILIPAFNEEKAIASVVERLKKSHPDDEILVVDDASTDQTAKLAETAGARVIRHQFNLGYGGALKTGIRHAQNEILMFFDADDQHDPADIHPIVEALENTDMAVGARPKGSGALYRRSGKWFLHRVANYLVGHPIPDLNSGLRAIRRNLALQFLHLLPNGFSFSTTITLALMRSGFQVAYVPIKVKERIGKSTLSLKDFFKTLFLIIRMITLFAPLKIYVPVTGLLLLIAIPSLIYDILQHNITDTTVLLWLMTVVIFLFGLLADTVALMSRRDLRSPTDKSISEG
jgi:glycosyltransferase involved in cell wall biosynthesis